MRRCKVKSKPKIIIAITIIVVIVVTIIIIINGTQMYSPWGRVNCPGKAHRGIPQGQLEHCIGAVEETLVIVMIIRIIRISSLIINGLLEHCIGLLKRLVIIVNIL